jgi:hypothetical protein
MQSKLKQEDNNNPQGCGYCAQQQVQPVQLDKGNEGWIGINWMKE